MPLHIVVVSATMEKLAEYRVLELKEILKELKLSTAGSKAELIARLYAADSESLSRAIDKVTNGMTVEEEDECSSPLEGNTAAESRSVSERRNSDMNNLLQRELELLRRENAVLQRELQWAERGRQGGELASAPRAPATSVIRIREIGDLLADFTGENDTFNTWKGQAEILRTTYQLNEDAMKILLSSHLKGKAQEWFHSTPTHLRLSTEELFEQMERMFNQRRNKLELRRNLEKRTWQSMENFPTYFHAKLVLANKASIAKEEIIDYIIDGISDTRMRDQARIQQFNTEDDLLKAFANISLPSYSGGFQRKKEGRTEKTDRQRDEKKGEQKDKVSLPREGRLRCFNCSEFGHTSSECTKPVREKGSCFRCGSKTHKIKDCHEETKKKQPPPQETTNVVQSDNNTEPFMKIVNYTIIDDCNSTVNFQVNAMIDTGSPISLIRKEYVPYNVRKPIPSDMTSYYGVNKSKINILGIFETDCIIDGASTKLTFFIVPVETITFSAILGRDYIRPHCREISSSIVNEKNNEKRVHESKNKQVEKLNDIFQIDCMSDKKSTVEKLNINLELEHPIKEEVAQLFTNEYVEKNN